MNFFKLYNIINIIHVVILLFPLVLIFLHTNLSNNVKFIIVLIYISIPFQYFIFNACSLTELSKVLGDKHITQTKSSSPFSEQYLYWFYKPILQIFNYEWNDYNLDKIIKLHWIINIIIILFKFQ